MDTGRVELRRGSESVPVEPQVFDLLAFLVANRERVIAQDEIFDSVWHGRIVSLSTLTSRINAARAAIGDDGRRQEKIKTVMRKGYRFVAEVTEDSGTLAPAVQPAAENVADLRQEVKFCTALMA